MKKCTCGVWHAYKHCKSPITSNGIINVNERMEYLMICRKKTLGYVDFIRGKYSITTPQHLCNLINEMTVQEKKDILTHPFLYLWEDLWGSSSDGGIEETHSFERFAMITNGCIMENKRVTLAELIQESTTKWEEPEWGFPKGRRNQYESDMICALREYEEETGYDRKDLKLIKNIMPYEEIFIGSNYKSYKHKYFVGLSYNSSPIHGHQESEVSKVEWVRYEDALRRIRPYNVERKYVLGLVHSMIQEYCQ